MGSAETLLPVSVTSNHATCTRLSYGTTLSILAISSYILVGDAHILLVATLAVLTFASVQGTNPGYLHSPRTEVEELFRANHQSFNSCSRCNISRRPLRAHHCSKCDRCVATFDHHCLVINTCIGELNHCRFVYFLISNFGACCYTILSLCSAFEEKSSNDQQLSRLQKEGIQILIGFLVLVGLYLTILVITQVCLVFSSMTSYECSKAPGSIARLANYAPPFRGRSSRPNVDSMEAALQSEKHAVLADDFDLPFSRGVFENLRGFCCVRDRICRLLRFRLRLISAIWRRLRQGGGITWNTFSDVRVSSDDAFEEWQISSLRRVPWHDVEIWENICSNKYYSCC